MNEKTSKLENNQATDGPTHGNMGASSEAGTAETSTSIPEAKSEQPGAGEQADDARQSRPFSSDNETLRSAADQAVLAQSRRHTRRAFLAGGLAAAAGYGFYRSLKAGPQQDMLPAALDSAYRFNARMSQELLPRNPLAPTYDVAAARELRVNGVFGLEKVLESESYRLQVVGVQNAKTHPCYVPDVTSWEYRYHAEKSTEDSGHDNKTDPKTLTSAKMPPASVREAADKREKGLEHPERGSEEAGESESTLAPGTPGLLLQLEDFLPHLEHHQLVTQFKCIEGWSEIVHWGGVRLQDFLIMFPPQPIDGKEPKYLYMETPDGNYYVGYDLQVCRHPQALLVTEMMGKPLTQFHGAPLRVHMPFKYGYKQIKRVGLIAYTNDKPDDYWTKLGYDWYGGL